MLGTEDAKVLVAVADGDVSAVLDAAVAEARRRQVGVHLVHALGPSLLSEDMESWALVEGSLRREGGDLLEQAARSAEQLLGDEGPVVSVELVHGPVVPALTAMSRKAGVVFLQRRPGRHVPTLSVTNGVAAHAHAPVVAVPAGWQDAGATAAVVVGVKQPEPPHLVVRSALEAARSRGAGLRIVHAWSYSPAYDDLVYAGHARVELEARLRSEYADGLRELLAEFADVPTEVVVEHGRHAEVLARESRGASLLVLGRHQSRAPLAPHLGSVVRAVLREAACPVMVVDPLPEHARPDAPATMAPGPARDSEGDRSPVVVAVDGSPDCHGAVRRAVHEARAAGTSVRIVHVLPDYVPVSMMMPLTPADLAQTGQAILRAAEEVARSAGPDVEVETLLTRGARPRAIVEAASDARLLLVGRDRPMAQRLVSGRTAAAVAGRCPCPVESVPPDWDAAGDRGVVVVGVRSPEHADHLLAHAFQLAAGRGARLVVLHAWKLPGGYADVIEARVGSDAWAERWTTQLEPVLDEARSRFPDVATEIRVVHDRPADALLAASEDADLLVLMRRHQVGPDAWRLGATGRTVLGAAHCSVHVVAPPEAVPAAGAPVERSHDTSAVSG